MSKYKIVRHKKLGNWFVYKRTIFSWELQDSFFSLSEAVKFIGNHRYKIVDEHE